MISNFNFLSLIWSQITLFWLERKKLFLIKSFVEINSRFWVFSIVSNLVVLFIINLEFPLQVSSSDVLKKQVYYSLFFTLIVAMNVTKVPIKTVLIIRKLRNHIIENLAFLLFGQTLRKFMIYFLNIELLPERGQTKSIIFDIDHF